MLPVPVVPCLVSVLLVVADLLAAPALVPAVPAAPAAVMAAAPWTTRTATPADAFVDTVGVAIHANYGDTSYGRHDLLALLRRLGVRQIRDGANEESLPFYRRFVQQAGRGAGVSYVVDSELGDVAGLLRLIADQAPGTASQIESDNEPDCDGWSGGEAEQLHEQARRMREVMDSEPALRDVPLATPSFCQTSQESYRTYGDDGVSARFTMHPYVAGYLPEREIGEFLGWQRAAAPGTVAVVSEGGFHNAVNTEGGHRPTSERAESAYLPQMFLEYARRGIALTHTYELLDLQDDPGRTDDQKNFGLYRADGTLKPAGASLAALVRTLADRTGPRPPNRRVRLGLRDDGAELRMQPYARSDGSYDVVLWRAQEIWEPFERRDLPNPSADVTVSVPTSTSGSYVRIAGRERPERVPLGTASTFTVPVSAHPTILRLGAGASAGATRPAEPTAPARPRSAQRSRSG